jgi:hypothetical protein
MLMKTNPPPPGKKRPTSRDGNQKPSKVSKSSSGTDQPGDPSNFGTFVRTNLTETRLAGYLGFDCTSQLRAFLLTWPVLDAVVTFHQNKVNNFNAVMKLIHKHEDVLAAEILNPQAGEQGDEADKEEPDSLEGEKAATQRVIAKSLLKLESAIRKMGKNAPTENRIQFDRATAEFKKEFNKDVPEGVANLPIVLPALGPLDNETRMESVNRCLQLTRHFLHDIQFQGKSNYKSKSNPKGTEKGNTTWQLRFATLDKVTHKAEVPVSSIPSFMRPVESEPITQDQLAKQVAERLDESPLLPRLDMRIVWDKEILTKGRDFLISELKKVELKDMPSVNSRKPSHDLRLFTCKDQLRQMLRQMFPCPPVRLDPCVMNLTGKGAKRNLDLNINMEMWDTVVEELKDPAYSEFELTVQFDAWNEASGEDFPEDIVLLPELEYLITDDTADPDVSGTLHSDEEQSLAALAKGGKGYPTDD